MSDPIVEPAVETTESPPVVTESPPVVTESPAEVQKKYKLFLTNLNLQ